MWIEQVSLKDLEEKICRLPYCQRVHLDYDSYANLELPNLPPFNYIFDELCNVLQDLPTQEAYAAYYLKSAVDRNYMLPELYIRAKRNYPSFVREYHLYCLLREYGKGRVHFNRVVDALGIDFILEYKQRRYGLRSFVDTPYSKKHYQRKYPDDRDEVLKSILKLDGIIDLPIVEDTATEVNGYWLYNQSHIEWLYRQVKERRAS